MNEESFSKTHNVTLPIASPKVALVRSSSMAEVRTSLRRKNQVMFPLLIRNRSTDTGCELPESCPETWTEDTSAFVYGLSLSLIRLNAAQQLPIGLTSVFSELSIS